MYPTLFPDCRSAECRDDECRGAVVAVPVRRCGQEMSVGLAIKGRKYGRK